MWIIDVRNGRRQKVGKGQKVQDMKTKDEKIWHKPAVVVPVVISTLRGHTKKSWTVLRKPGH